MFWLCEHRSRLAAASHRVRQSYYRGVYRYCPPLAGACQRSVYLKTFRVLETLKVWRYFTSSDNTTVRSPPWSS